jgi:hypothetical protein
MYCLGEPVGGKAPAGYGPWTNPQLMDTLSPEELVAKEGRDNRRDSSA